MYFSNKVCKEQGKSHWIPFPVPQRYWCIFTLSASACPVSSDCSAPSPSGRVPGWAGRAGLSLLSQGKLKLHIEPGWERTVLGTPLSRAMWLGQRNPHSLTPTLPMAREPRWVRKAAWVWHGQRAAAAPYQACCGCKSAAEALLTIFTPILHTEHPPEGTCRWPCG